MAFSTVIPPRQPRFAALFDVNPFIKELASDNSKARGGGPNDPHRVFEDDGKKHI
jgi:hypothetical protein